MIIYNDALQLFFCNSLKWSNSTTRWSLAALFKIETLERKDNYNISVNCCHTAQCLFDFRAVVNFLDTLVTLGAK